jgi:hypothetical protein
MHLLFPFLFDPPASHARCDTRYVLNWLADFSSTVDLDEQDLIIKLVLSVLAPLFCGKALTAICAPVRRFAAEYKSLLKYISMYVAVHGITGD